VNFVLLIVQVVPDPLQNLMILLGDGGLDGGTDAACHY